MIDLGPDEPPLHIRVNLSRRFRRLQALPDGPGSRLDFACREECDQSEQVIGGFRQPDQP